MACYLTLFSANGLLNYLVKEIKYFHSSCRQHTSFLIGEKRLMSIRICSISIFYHYLLFKIIPCIHLGGYRMMLSFLHIWQSLQPNTLQFVWHVVHTENCSVIDWTVKSYLVNTTEGDNQYLSKAAGDAPQNTVTSVYRIHFSMLWPMSIYSNLFQYRVTYLSIW